MPYCPRCMFEYKEGVTRCLDCAEDLLPGSPPAAESPIIGAAPVRLCTVPDVNAGDILVAVLADNGIPAFARRHGPITGDLGRVTDGHTEDYSIIMVPPGRLEEAQRVLTALASGPVEWPEGMEPEE